MKKELIRKVQNAYCNAEVTLLMEHLEAFDLTDNMKKVGIILQDTKKLESYDLIDWKDDYFVGEVLDGMPNGFGILFEGKNIMIGQWINGVYDGKFVCIYDNGVLGVGNFGSSIREEYYKNGNLLFETLSNARGWYDRFTDDKGDVFIVE